MNTRPSRPFTRRCLIPAFLTVTALVSGPAAFAQPTPQPAPEAGPTFNLEVRNGTKMSGGQSPATIKNLVEYVRQQNPDMNFVLAPGVESVVVENLELRSADVPAFVKALEFATARAVGGGQISPNTWALTSRDRHPTPRAKQVEVFNLSGYLHHLRQQDPRNDVERNLDQLKTTIEETLVLQKGEDISSEERPAVRFHPGANLLIVVGSPEAIDIARKIVSALPGQQPDPLRMAGKNARLLTLRQREAQLLRQFTEDHPNVIQLREEIRQLDQKPPPPGAFPERQPRQPGADPLPAVGY